MDDRNFFVYIMTSAKGTLYVGVTNDLERRVQEHKAGTLAGFTRKYAIDLLVYYEQFQYIDDAIGREKQIKGWRREKKKALVESQNPTWKDLSADWL
jgi:putative endonuclease